jgi:cytochrome c oxidase cbb3-type subunit 2
MPSYAHLFAPGDRRGEDLVEYLAALGAADAAGRLAIVEAATVPAPLVAGDAGGALFRDLCAACHGESGRGDGPLARHFARRAIDLTKPRLFHDPGDLAGTENLAALQKLIRWGVPGTAMAGHETLSDDEIGALARQVAALRSGSSARGAP